MFSIRRFHPKLLRRSIAAALAAIAMSASPAGANPAEHELDLPASPPRLTFEFTPALWMPRLLGDARLGSGPFFDVDDDLSLRDAQATFLGELLALDRNGRRYRVSGFDFSVHDRGVSRSFFGFGSVGIVPGDAFTAELEMRSVAGEISLPLLSRESRDGGSGIRLSPVFGTRIIDLRQEVEEPGVAREHRDSIWIAPYAGGEIEVRHRRLGGFPWGDHLSLRASGAIGPALGGDDGFMSQVRAAVALDPTESLSLQFGFNLIWLDVDDADYEFDGSLQGLFFAATWRF